MKHNGSVTELASRTWWDEANARADTPIRELVAGFDDVGGLAIPYARLPLRVHKAYSDAFSCWADIGDESVESLLSRRGVGDVAVRALVQAARDAVAAHRDLAARNGSQVAAAAAVRRLLDALGESDRVILSARLWGTRPLSQREVAERLGISSKSVERNQPRMEARFAELLAEPTHHIVSEYAEQLRRRLGPYAPAQIVADELCSLDVGPSTETARVLLHLAGPYAQRAGWFANTTTGGRREVLAAIDAVFARDPAPSTETLIGALKDHGVPPNVGAAYLCSGQTALRRFGHTWVRWDGSIADKAEAVLHARRTPATAREILEAIGANTTRSLRAVREALYDDYRFVRASRLTWGLHTWGIDEYEGLFEEIAALIDASKGGLTVEEIIEAIRTRFPDVTENSVRTYTSSPLAFVNDAGVLRRRTKSDPWPTVPPLNTVRGAFFNGSNEIRWALRVTSDVLRGSGLAIRRAVAAALGVNPGQRRTFNSPHGEVTVAWGLASTRGPSIGTLRPAALAADAEVDDTLVLIFRLEEAALDVARIGAHVTGSERLRLLLGRTVRNPAAALAKSLRCAPAEAAAVLRARGDEDLAELISE